MRVLLDANVLVSARIKPRGAAGGILNQAGAQYDLQLPDFLLDKVDEVLRRPHIQRKYPHITADAVADYVAALQDLGEPVIQQTKIEPSPQTSEDLEDLCVLAAAVDGKAQYLVTYNVKHFPKIYQATYVYLPTEFSQMLLL